MSQSQETIEPYKLLKLFSLISEFDVNAIFSTSLVVSIAVNDQKWLLTLRIKIKLKRNAAE